MLHQPTNVPAAVVQVANGAKSPSGRSLALARRGLDFPAPASEKEFANLGQISPSLLQNPSAYRQTEKLKIGSPRMGRKYHSEIAVDLTQRLENSLRCRALVDVGRPVQCDRGIPSVQAISLDLFVPAAKVAK